MNSVRWKALVSRVTGLSFFADALRSAVIEALQSARVSADGGADSATLFDVEGRFWDPTVPERQVRGRLRWTGQKGTLELEDLLRPGLENLLNPGRNVSRGEIDVIAGRSVLGEPLCLTDCFVHRTQGAVVQHPQAWTVNGTLVGVDTRPSHIDGLELRVPAMRGFYGTPLVDFDREPAGPRQKITISWLSSPELSFELHGAKLVFDDDWGVTGELSDLTLRATPRVRLLSSQPVGEEELDPLIAPLMLLIGICLRRDVAVAEERLLLGEDRQARRLQGRRVVLSPAEEPHPWLAIGNLDPQQRTFERWFAFCNELPKAVAMLSEYLRAGPATPSEDQLLYLARFIEQYHRARYVSARMPKADFRTKRGQARDRLGGDLGDWVFTLSEHANERALAERLQELVDIHAHALGGVLGPDPGAFAQRVADTRNYYTHYSEHLVGKAATDLEFIVLTQRLWALVRICLLSELAFSPEESRELLSLDNSLGWLSRQP